MANVNSSAPGYVSLPSQLITTTAATVLQVPAASAAYPGLPNIMQLAGTALYLDLAKTVQSSNPLAASPTYVNDAIDGHQFKVRVVGVAVAGAGTTFAPSLYNGTSTTVASDTLICSAAAFTFGGAASANFVFEINLLWDSTSQKLNGWFQSSINNTFTAPAAITAISSLAVTNLQFLPAFTFGTANAANAVVIKELLFENV